MGLTIHFQLSLPATTPRAHVVQRLEQLRSAAVALPFDDVGAVTFARAGETLGDQMAARPLLERCFLMWAWLQVERGVVTVDEPITDDAANQYEPIETTTYENDFEDGVLPEAIGFAVDVGINCEPAMFGLAWVPPRDADFRQLDDQPPVWRWHCSCRTAYACLESGDHFIRCHTAIVALLDHAKAIGFAVGVGDESGYWETRDLGRLQAHAEQRDGLVELSGALSDGPG